MSFVQYKSVMYEWCAKRGTTPRYEVQQTGPPHCKQFTCVLKVDKIDHEAVGSSTSKKEAEKIASECFVLYLVKNNLLKPLSNVPVSELADVTFPNMGDFKLSQEQSSNIGREQSSNIGDFKLRREQSPNSLKSLSLAVSNEQNSLRRGIWEEVSSGVIDDAKSKLNLFVQAHNIPMIYIYNFDSVSKLFIAKTAFSYLDKDISGSGTGSTKQKASKECASVVVRQLQHLGLMTAPAIKNRSRSLSHSTSVSPEPGITTSVPKNLGTFTDSILNNSSTTFNDPIILDFGKTSKQYHSTPLQPIKLNSSDHKWNIWDSSDILERPVTRGPECKTTSTRPFIKDPFPEHLLPTIASVLSSNEQKNTDCLISTKPEEQYLSSFQAELGKKFSQKVLNVSDDLAAASNPVRCDISKINFKVYLEMFKTSGNCNEFDIFGYYIATVLKWLPLDQAVKLRNDIIALVERKQMPDMKESSCELNKGSSFELNKESSCKLNIQSNSDCADGLESASSSSLNYDEERKVPSTLSAEEEYKMDLLGECDLLDRIQCDVKIEESPEKNHLNQVNICSEDQIHVPDFFGSDNTFEHDDTSLSSKSSKSTNSLKKPHSSNNTTNQKELIVQNFKKLKSNLSNMKSTNVNDIEEQ